MKVLTSLILLLVISTGPAMAQTGDSKGQPSSPSKATPSETNWYRIDYTLSEFENGKKTNVRAYSLNAEESGRGGCRVRTGNRVPILKTVGSNSSDVLQYLDIGVDIRCSLRSTAAGLDLYSSLDVSSIASDSNYMKQGGVGAPIIRGLQCDSNSFVTLGKQSVVASMDDPNSPGRKYVLEATVTKLNP